MPVEPSSWAPWISMIVQLLGAGAIGALVTHWATSKREREAREHAASERRKSQWDDLQTKKLVELQDAIDRFVRSTEGLDSAARRILSDTTGLDTFRRVCRRYEAALTRVICVANVVDDDDVNKVALELVRAADKVRASMVERLARVPIPERLPTGTDELGETCERLREQLDKVKASIAGTDGSDGETHERLRDMKHIFVIVNKLIRRALRKLHGAPAPPLDEADLFTFP